MQTISAADKLLKMIRPFQLRDLALVHRLGENGVLLHAQAALTSSSHPLRSALKKMLVGGHYMTFIWKAEDREASAIVQLRWDGLCPGAHLAFFGWEHSTTNDESDGENIIAIDEDIWAEVLDQLVADIGQRGAHNLIAEASETGDELPILRRSGFAIYTRQDIWIYDQNVQSNDQDILQPHRSIDDWDINVLYSNIVPRLIQSVEPNPPVEYGHNWVLREDNELVALIHFRSGHVASWMRLFIHPNASTKPRSIIQAALQANRAANHKPVFCCIRRYQSWLQNPLEQAGFKLWGSQAVMVRHIAQHFKQSEPLVRRALEPQTVPGTSTMVQGFSGQNGGNKINN